MTMDRPTLTITHDELAKPEVDDRLEAQRQHRATLQHFENAQVIVPTNDRQSMLARPWFVLGTAAILGATLAGMVWIALSLAGVIGRQTIDLASELQAINKAYAAGRIDGTTASAARDALVQSVGWLPATWLPLCGAMIGLGVVERAIDRDVLAAVGRGLIAALLTAALIALGGMFGSELGWVLVGILAGVTPGALDKVGRRALLGAGCGLLGGLLAMGTAWALPDHIASDVVASILGAGFIGITLGLAETRQKLGRLQVEQGLIAGKSFLLYRDPTLLGSALNSHIYLFRDREVGRRHAAIRKTPGGYVVENLPLGGPTLVNDQPVTRAKLRSGDTLKVGRTVLRFSEQGHG